MPLRLPPRSFNSMKVRLKLIKQLVLSLTMRQFQFHEGPIKTKHFVTLCQIFIRFNSMKVRLKLSLFENVLKMHNSFQFHEGPIKTRTFPVRPLVARCFNSMKVRLKPASARTSWGLRLCFNSMKVRLKHLGAWRGLNKTLCFNSMKVRLKLVLLVFTGWGDEFQFHEGPIKTRCP